MVTIQVEVDMDVGITRDQGPVFWLPEIKKQTSCTLIHQLGEALSIQWIKPNVLIVALGRQTRAMHPPTRRNFAWRVLSGLQRLLRSLWCTIVGVLCLSKKRDGR